MDYIDKTDTMFQTEAQRLEWESLTKLGRCCYTCNHRGRRVGSSFYECKGFLNDHPDPVWQYAHCNEWFLPNVYKQKKRIQEYQRLIDRPGTLRAYLTPWGYIGRPSVVPPQYLCNANPDTRLKLGKVCFVCRYRGKAVSRNRVECTLLDGEPRIVWPKAKCKRFLLQDDFRIVDRYFKPHMAKSGADMDDPELSWYSYRTSKYADSERFEALYQEMLQDFYGGERPTPGDPTELLREASAEFNGHMRNSFDPDEAYEVDGTDEADEVDGGADPSPSPSEGIFKEASANLLDLYADGSLDDDDLIMPPATWETEEDAQQEAEPWSMERGDQVIKYDPDRELTPEEAEYILNLEYKSQVDGRVRDQAHMVHHMAKKKKRAREVRLMGQVRKGELKYEDVFPKGYKFELVLTPEEKMMKASLPNWTDDDVRKHRKEMAERMERLASKGIKPSQKI